MRFEWACLGLCASALLGCDSTKPNLTLVSPAQAYGDWDTPLTLVGNGFLPAHTVDPTSGRRIASAEGFHARLGKGSQWLSVVGLDWQGPGHMTGTLPRAVTPDQLPVGSLDVELTDPRGQRSVLADGFVNLGHDTSAPLVTLTSPTGVLDYKAGETLQGGFHAEDVAPGTLASMAWSYFERGQSRASVTCFITAGTAAADCAFKTSIDRGLTTGDVVEIRASATDQAGNVGVASLHVALTALPTIVSMAPASGGTAGGTDVVIKGTGFLPGSQAFLDGLLLFPAGGLVVDAQTISGHVPAHAAGGVSLTVKTPRGSAISTAVFTYGDPPLIANVAPASGSSTSATAVTIGGQYFTEQTRFYFGKTLASAVELADLHLQSANSAVGHVPPGQGPTTVWAYDATLGYTRLVDGFTWETR
jgi:hypothetical protein